MKAIIIKQDAEKRKSMDKTSMRALIEGFYGLQKTRIQTGNQILANTYAKLGIKPGKKKEDGLTKRRINK
jgi:predicted nucleotidyltransferase